MSLNQTCKMTMFDLVLNLLRLAKRASHLSRFIRQEPTLFSLLVEEKSGPDKHAGFREDFKTLADVLIQEMIRHDLEDKFPTLKNLIFGEESAKFKALDGGEVCLSLTGGSDKIAASILRIIGQEYEKASQLLAHCVYDEHSQSENKDLAQMIEVIPQQFKQLPVYENMGVWIDPIDGTNVYVQTNESSKLTKDESGKIVLKHLPCVTVLIGLFDRATGIPIIGVLDQPFWQFDTKSNQWNGRTFWGSVPCPNCKLEQFAYGSSLIKGESGSGMPITIISPADDYVDLFRKAGCTTVSPRGAGYKFLCVAEGFADLAAQSSSRTYLWDSCAAQAILNALGGNVLKFQAVARDVTVLSALTDEELKAKIEAEYVVKYCDKCPKADLSAYENAQGLLGYRSFSDLRKVLNILKRK